MKVNPELGLTIRSALGKRIAVTAICLGTEDANRYMRKTPDEGAIANDGELIFLARNSDKGEANPVLRMLLANLKHAKRNRETVSIGGGMFGPQDIDVLIKALETC